MKSCVLPVFIVYLQRSVDIIVDCYDIVCICIQNCLASVLQKILKVEGRHSLKGYIQILTYYKYLFPLIFVSYLKRNFELVFFFPFSFFHPECRKQYRNDDRHQKYSFLNNYNTEECRSLMPDRKMWKIEQDRVLRLLKEERKEKKWSVIARIMETEFDIKGRTGKQCRERYHNHLDSSIKSAEWTQDEEAALYRLHEQLGNKWSLIAQRLVGRTDNCVKNHFYSKLRKAIRKLNKVISQKYKKICSEVKLTSLYKILQISQNKFKMNSKYDEELIDKCLTLKNTLYRLEPILDKVRTQAEDIFLQELIHDLNTFELKNKKSTKNAKKSKDSQISFSSKTEVEERVKKQEVSDQPFYQTFKRICEEMIRSNV